MRQTSYACQAPLEVSKCALEIDFGTVDGNSLCPEDGSVADDEMERHPSFGFLFQVYRQLFEVSYQSISQSGALAAFGSDNRLRVVKQAAARVVCSMISWSGLHGKEWDSRHEMYTCVNGIPAAHCHKLQVQPASHCPTHSTEPVHLMMMMQPLILTGLFTFSGGCCIEQETFAVARRPEDDSMVYGCCGFRSGTGMHQELPV